MFEKNGHILSFFDEIHFELWIAFFKVFICVFLTWRLVIKLDILMVQINQYTALNDRWRWNSKIKNRNWNLIHPYQFRTKLGLTFGIIWDFFLLIWRILGRLWSFIGRWFHVTWPNSSFKCRLYLKRNVFFMRVSSSKVA